MYTSDSWCSMSPVVLISSKVRIARSVFIAGCSNSRAEVRGGSVSDGVVKTTSCSSNTVRNVSNSVVL